MKKRMKFVGVSAAVLIALSSTPLPFLGAGVEQTVHADSTYDTILQNAIRSNYFEEETDWDGVYRDELRALVNAGATNALYKGTVINNFYTDVLSEIFNGQTLQDILGAAGDGARAQLLVNGKSQVTNNDLISPDLQLTVKIFATNGKTAEAHVALTTTSPALSINEDFITLNQPLGGFYLDFTSDVDSLSIPNNELGNWSIGSIDSATPNENRLKLMGVLNDDGEYIKAGNYTQEIVATLENADTSQRVTRKLTVTVSVDAPNEDQLTFASNDADAKPYRSGTTVLNSEVQDLDSSINIISTAKFSNHFHLNNPDYFDFTTKETDYEQLDVVLKQRFSELFLINDGVVTAPIAMELDKITVDSSAVDFSKVGVYAVPFSYTTDAGQVMSLTLRLNIRDTGTPVFEFETGQNKTIKVGETFNLNDFKVYSNNDLNTDESVDVQITGSVNTSKVGTYQLTYTATNVNRLTTTLIRTINVVDSDGESGETPVIAPISSIGYVNYVPGYGIRVWSAPNGNGTSQFLSHATAWKIDQKATFKNGSVWYRVGTNQWVDSQYISFTPVSNGPNMTELRGVGTVNYVSGYSVNVYRAPNAESQNWTGSQLKHGTKWRVYGEKNGFYNVGGNQWISSQYMTFVKD